MSAERIGLDGYNIGMEISAYPVKGQIDQAPSSLPGFLRHVVVVDDGSTDGTVGFCQRRLDGPGPPLLTFGLVFGGLNSYRCS